MSIISSSDSNKLWQEAIDIAKNDPEKAIELFRACYRATNNARAHFNIAMLSFRQRNYKRAEGAFINAFQLDSTLLIAKVQLALCQLLLNNPTHAVANLNTVLEVLGEKEFLPVTSGNQAAKISRAEILCDLAIALSRCNDLPPSLPPQRRDVFFVLAECQKCADALVVCGDQLLGRSVTSMMKHIRSDTKSVDASPFGLDVNFLFSAPSSPLPSRPIPGRDTGRPRGAPPPVRVLSVSDTYTSIPRPPTPLPVSPNTSPHSSFLVTPIPPFRGGSKSPTLRTSPVINPASPAALPPSPSPRAALSDPPRALVSALSSHDVYTPLPISRLPQAPAVSSSPRPVTNRLPPPPPVVRRVGPPPPRAPLNPAYVALVGERTRSNTETPTPTLAFEAAATKPRSLSEPPTEKIYSKIEKKDKKKEEKPKKDKKSGSSNSLIEEEMRRLAHMGLSRQYDSANPPTPAASAPCEISEPFLVFHSLSLPVGAAKPVISSPIPLPRSPYLTEKRRSLNQSQEEGKREEKRTSFNHLKEEGKEGKKEEKRTSYNHLREEGKREERREEEQNESTPPHARDTIVLPAGTLSGSTTASISHDQSYTDRIRATPSTLTPGNGSLLLGDALAQRISGWEIKEGELELKEELGRGASGVVYKALWRNGDCVVKCVNFPCAPETDLTDSQKNVQKEFVKEIMSLTKMRTHPNVCQMFGVCLTPTLSIVMELLQEGSVYDLLHDPCVNIDLAVAVNMMKQTASGMAHIHAEDILHCDLAARNLLVKTESTGNGRLKIVVKVSDFGMSKVLVQSDAYDATERKKFPIRWSAPEILRSRRIFRASDVWSFGVVMWEILERKLPFAELANQEVIEKVLNHRHRLPRPTLLPCSDMLWSVMLSCWQEQPEHRPTFTELYRTLHELDQELGRQEGHLDTPIRRNSDAGAPSERPYGRIPPKPPVENKNKMRFCTSCGHPLQSNVDIFCGFCGSKLAKATPPVR